MKSSGGDADLMAVPVDTLLMNCWTNEDLSTDVGHFLIEDTKLTLDDEDDLDQKPNIDELDLLLTATCNNNHPNGGSNNNNNNNNHQNGNHGQHHHLVHGNGNSLAELKPLPPFTGYTGHLSINGISGHHYHTIATAPNSSTNRVLVETNNNSSHAANQNHPHHNHHNHTNSNNSSNNMNVPYYSDHVVSSSTMDGMDGVKSEVMDYPLSGDAFDGDFAAIIGSAMADTTVGGGGEEDSRDSWLDLDAWIGSCTSPPTKVEATASFQQPPTFLAPQPQFHPMKEMRTFSHMPLLQNRLQNGPPKERDLGYNLECASPSSSTPYLAHSPPCPVVSTTDIGFIHSSRPSPELQAFPHTTTPGKKAGRNRSKTKSMAVVYTESGGGGSGVLGKEKTVHRCNICNRGFLNKSNIKVHLRTHTGEKPFRCEVCGKAFRQKAHLIKHAQIHKRIGRD